MSEELRPLPHYLRPGLRFVFIGFNPGLESARAGHYYARPGNAFWRQMSASGIAGRVVGPLDDSLLMDEAGIGFTDLCQRPTRRASELGAEELAAGARALQADLLEFQPKVAVFSAKGTFEQYGRHVLGLRRQEAAKRPYGPQPERVGKTEMWVIPSSSGLASKWHGERLALLRRMAEL